MARPPRLHFDWDEEDRQLSERFFEHDSDLWAHRESVRVLIQELLSKLPEENLKRDKVAERLLQLVLRDNYHYDEIAKGINGDTVLNRISMAYGVSKVTESTRQNIRSILDDSSIQHSGWSLREQSDKVLNWINSYPYPFEKDPSSPFTKPQVDWFQKHMPSILEYLKDSSFCSLGCMARTIWPPVQIALPSKKQRGKSESTIESLISFSHLATAPVGLKDAILAYHHNISVKTLRNYLQGHLPKTSRSASSSS